MGFERLDMFLLFGQFAINTGLAAAEWLLLTDAGDDIIPEVVTTLGVLLFFYGIVTLVSLVMGIRTVQNRNAYKDGENRKLLLLMVLVNFTIKAGIFMFWRYIFSSNLLDADKIAQAIHEDERFRSVAMFGAAYHSVNAVFCLLLFSQPFRRKINYKFSYQNSISS